MNRWHILGAGAMGCLLGQQLHAAGCSITLIRREAPHARSASIAVETEGTTASVPIRLDGPSDTDAISRLLVATKAPDIEASLRSVRHRIGVQTDVVIAANGMGFADAVQALLPNVRVHCCVTTEGAHRLGDLHIRHAGRGLTRLGRIGGGSAPPWFHDWLASPLNCHWEADIQSALWDKLAVNCAINPLTALYRCKNGELSSNAVLHGEVQQLCDEIAKVSQARGYGQVAENVHARVRQVIAATAENRSSMLQDVEAGRVTEIDFITGHLVREAQRLGIQVPANIALLEKVKTLDY